MHTHYVCMYTVYETMFASYTFHKMNPRMCIIMNQLNKYIVWMFLFFYDHKYDTSIITNNKHSAVCSTVYRMIQ